MTPDLWALPRAARLGQAEYPIYSDYRDILTVIGWLSGAQGAALPESARWYVALRLFYRDFAAVPPAQRQAAAEFLAAFLAGGRAPQKGPAPPRLLDWQQDAPLIAAGVNRAAGCDVRSLPYLHWWSFLAFFDAIGDGALSTVVAIRGKLRRGKKLEPWEQEYYREHRAQVDLPPRPAARTLGTRGEEAAAKAEHDRLLALLDG